jgi:hypothetical protein
MNQVEDTPVDPTRVQINDDEVGMLSQQFRLEGARAPKLGSEAPKLGSSGSCNAEQQGHRRVHAVQQTLRENRNVRMFPFERVQELPKHLAHRREGVGVGGQQHDLELGQETVDRLDQTFRTYAAQREQRGKLTPGVWCLTDGDTLVPWQLHRQGQQSWNGDGNAVEDQAQSLSQVTVRREAALV